MEQQLFTYAKRSAMRKTAAYKAVKKAWIESGLNTIENCGVTGYLLREFIEKLSLTNKKRVKHEEWLQFYLDSGETRLNINKSNNIYYGRSLSDLNKLSDKISEKLDESCHEIILNTLISEIIDNEYRNYITMTRLCRYIAENYDLICKISSSQDYITSEIDLLAFNSDILQAAIKILRPGQTPDMQKYQIFEDINAAPVRCLYLDSNDNPCEPLNL